MRITKKHFKEHNENIKKIEKEINQHLDRAGIIWKKKRIVVSKKKDHEEKKDGKMELNKNIISADDFENGKVF